MISLKRILFAITLIVIIWFCIGQYLHNRRKTTGYKELSKRCAANIEEIGKFYRLYMKESNKNVLLSLQDLSIYAGDQPWIFSCDLAHQHDLEHIALQNEISEQSSSATTPNITYLYLRKNAQKKENSIVLLCPVYHENARALYRDGEVRELKKAEWEKIKKELER